MFDKVSHVAWKLHLAPRLSELLEDRVRCLPMTRYTYTQESEEVHRGHVLQVLLVLVRVWRFSSLKLFDVFNVNLLLSNVIFIFMAMGDVFFVFLAPD